MTPGSPAVVSGTPGAQWTLENTGSNAATITYKTSAGSSTITLAAGATSRVRSTDGTVTVASADGSVEVRADQASPALKSYRNLGQAATAQVVIGEAKLLRARGENGTNSLLWLQFHDLASAPNSGDVPKESIPVGIGVADGFTAVDRSFTSGGVPFANGIRVAWSSTANTYTAVSPSAGAHAIEADYV